VLGSFLIDNYLWFFDNHMKLIRNFIWHISRKYFKVNIERSCFLERFEGNKEFIET